MKQTMRPGFTMIELLIAMVVMGVLVVTAAKGYKSIQNSLNARRTKSMLISLKQSLDAYRADMKHYPSTDRNEKGLQALVTKPAKINTQAGEQWVAPYYPEEPKDAWSNDIEYNCPPKRNKEYKKYELISYGVNGPDGDAGTEIHDGE